jgi:hypothetical protein
MSFLPQEKIEAILGLYEFGIAHEELYRDSVEAEFLIHITPGIER